MTFADVYEGLPDGWLSRDEAELLWRYASRSAGPFVEIGSYNGRSSVVLASVAAMRGTHLYCIDPWANDFGDAVSGDERFRRWQANTEGLPVVACRCRVEDWTPVRASLCFLDGDHSHLGTTRQILQAMRCHPEFILVHDCNDVGQGRDVRDACLEALGPWHERVERLAAWEVSRVGTRRTALVELTDE